jgi:hypothetical protein
MASTSDIYQSIRVKIGKRCECGHLEESHKHGFAWVEIKRSDSCMACPSDKYYHDFSESLESVVFIEREVRRLLGDTERL